MKILFLSLAVLSAALLFGQDSKCVDQNKIASQNDCDPCTTPSNLLPVGQILLKQKKFEEMSETLDQIIEQTEQWYEMEGDLEWGRNTLEMEMASIVRELIEAIDEAEADQAKDPKDVTSDSRGYMMPKKLKEAMRKAEDELSRIRAEIDDMPHQAYTPASHGTTFSDEQPSLESLTGTTHISDITHRIIEMKQQGYGPFSIDCCDPENYPNSFLDPATQSLKESLDSIESYFNHFTLVFPVFLESTTSFAEGYRHFSNQMEHDVNKLKNLSFGGWLLDVCVDKGLISKSQRWQIEDLFKTATDINSLKNSIAQIDPDLGEAFGVLFGDFGVLDMRKQADDVLKNMARELPKLHDLNKKIPKFKALGDVLGAIQIAEISIQVLTDLALKLEGENFINAGKDRWWQTTKWFYLHTLSNLIQHATAIHTYQQVLEMYASMFGDETICLAGPVPPESERKENAEASLGSVPDGADATEDGLVFQKEDGTKITISWDCNCGKLKDMRPAEITPVDKPRIGLEGGVWYPKSDRMHPTLPDPAKFITSGTTSGEQVTDASYGDIFVFDPGTGFICGAYLEYPVDRGLSIEGGITYGRYHMQGEVPVDLTILSQGSPTQPPTTSETTEPLALEFDVQIYSLDIEGCYYPPAGAIRPYIKPGISFRSTAVPAVTTSFRGMEYPIAVEFEKFQPFLCGAIGLDIPLGDHFGVQVEGGVQVSTDRLRSDWNGKVGLAYTLGQ